MSIVYDIAFIKADEKIDIIKDYLASLGEDNIYEIQQLTRDLDFFIQNYLQEEQENEMD